MARAPKKKSGGKFDLLIDLRRSRIESFEKSEERYHPFMKEMIAEQRTVEEREREKDREFFLQVGKMFAQ